jgi:hypothetical protein
LYSSSITFSSKKYMVHGPCDRVITTAVNYGGHLLHVAWFVSCVVMA